MSGGVDSAVAAARMAEAGHDVVGVHLALSRNPQSYRSGARGCCTIEDSRDARRAADVIGIPFYIWDLAERFHADVVEDFVAEYAAGRTPNPCLRCNEKVKFSAVLDRALALDFDAVATGHYAQIVETPGGRELHRAVDPAKDQSYVLGVLTQQQLKHAFFPLGDTPKTEIRAEHKGTHGFTVGQRKGLKIGTPAADGKPRFVLDISPVDRRVTVGSREELAVERLTASKPRWCGPVPTETLHVKAQLRAHGEQIAATARLEGDQVLVEFDEAADAVAPGQAVVLYDGTRVIGSATIDTVERATQKV
jgi:tRNA-specific 2-thiouridylase